MNENVQPQKQQQQQRPARDRMPIRIARLLFRSENSGSQIGMKLPDGTEGRGEKYVAHLDAGIHGATKVEIERLPWPPVFRVTKSRRVTRTERHNGKDVEVESWVPMGPTFDVPDDWAVSVPAED